MVVRTLLVVGCVLWSPLCSAQSGPRIQGGASRTAPADSGTVTGTVLSQDAQGPIRFASVTLWPIATALTQATGGSSGYAGGRMGGQRDPSIGRGGNFNTRTDIEGNFLTNGVSPGDYYVLASAPGYVSEHALLAAQAAAGADPEMLLASVPTVRVVADASSSVTLSLQRGGDISGHVEWADGSPATGVSVSAVSPMSVAPVSTVLQAIPAFGGSNFAMTDDRGVYRIPGLMSGDYLVRVSLPNPMPSVRSEGRDSFAATQINLYAPGVYRRTEAKTITIHLGEDRNDADIMLDTRGLRSVSGHVSSTNAGQSVNIGSVTLTDSNSSDLSLGGAISANGDFLVRFVPPGTYNIQVTGGSIPPSGAGRGAGGSVWFKPSTQTLSISGSDVSGLAVTLTPVNAQ